MTELPQNPPEENVKTDAAESEPKKNPEINSKMQKQLLIAAAITAGVVVVLITILLIAQACSAKEEAFSLPDTYFYPTHVGDIFEYEAYMDKRPDVVLYCQDPNGLGHTTSVDDDKADELPAEVFYLHDFLQIMMHADMDAYHNCFDASYYKSHQKQIAFSQQMIYDAEIRFVSEEMQTNGDRCVTYYLLYKLFENDGSLRRDVGSDAVVPMRIVLRVTQKGEISITAWSTTRTQ